jgi:FKBP-type peptidyl-prolyl cis-trans isomerase
MRRTAAALLVPLLAGLALVGCGSSSGSATANPNADVKVSGAFNKAPQVKIPAKAASGKLSITTPIKGTGPSLVSGDDVLANVAIYVWSGKTNKLLQSTYTAVPQVLPSNIGLTGLATAIKDKPMGTRVVAVLPPKYGYGTSGNSELGITGADTTVWVVDLIKSFSPTASATGQHVSDGGGSLPQVKPTTAGVAPTITIPKNSPPSALITKTLIKGSGPKLASGQDVVAQYVAVNWRTKKVFNTTWPSSSSAGTPFSFALADTDVVPGFVKGLTGATVGSRVMLVIPPVDGYGKAGQSSAGIKGTDTLVFVVDILAALPASSAT